MSPRDLLLVAISFAFTTSHTFAASESRALPAAGPDAEQAATVCKQIERGALGKLTCRGEGDGNLTLYMKDKDDARGDARLNGIVTFSYSDLSSSDPKMVKRAIHHYAYYFTQPRYQMLAKAAGFSTMTLWGPSERYCRQIVLSEMHQKGLEEEKAKIMDKSKGLPEMEAFVEVTNALWSKTRSVRCPEKPIVELNR